VIRDVWCPGPQNDVSIWGDTIVTSVDDVLTGSACGSTRAVPQTLETGWEGLRMFSLKRILATPAAADGFTRVQPVAAVYTACGSHTHTGIRQASRVLIYVSSYSLRSGPDCGPGTTRQTPTIRSTTRSRSSRCPWAIRRPRVY
jgi:hypothetical protein